VVLYVDCEQITSVEMDPKGVIDVNGDIVLGKDRRGSTVPVS